MQTTPDRDLVQTRRQGVERVRRPRWRPDFARLAEHAGELPSLPRASGGRALLGLPGGALGLPTEPPRAPREPVLALLQRITQGFELGEYERARALGYEAYLEE